MDDPRCKQYIAAELQPVLCDSGYIPNIIGRLGQVSERMAEYVTAYNTVNAMLTEARQAFERQREEAAREVQKLTTEIATLKSGVTLSERERAELTGRIAALESQLEGVTDLRARTEYYELLLRQVVEQLRMLDQQSTRLLGELPISPVLPEAQVAVGPLDMTLVNALYNLLLMKEGYPDAELSDEERRAALQVFSELDTSQMTAEQVAQAFAANYETIQKEITADDKLGPMFATDLGRAYFKLIASADDLSQALRFLEFQQLGALVNQLQPGLTLPDAAAATRWLQEQWPLRGGEIIGSEAYQGQKGQLRSWASVEEGAEEFLEGEEFAPKGAGLEERPVVFGREAQRAQEEARLKQVGELRRRGLRRRIKRGRPQVPPTGEAMELEEGPF